MRILVAPDSFKGTMSSRQAARALAGGLTAGLAGVSCQIVPLSDGGEGLIDCVLAALGGERRRARRSIWAVKGCLR